MRLVGNVSNATTFVDSPPLSAEPYFYGVKAVDAVGASPMSAESCAIMSPFGSLLIPTCALPADARVDATRVGAEGELAAVDGKAEGDAYVVNATLDERTQPGVAVYNPGLVEDDIHQGTGESPANATLPVTTWSSPSAAPCAVRVGGDCLAPVPLDPARGQFWGAAVEAEVEAGEVHESVGTPFVPYAGGVLALLP